MKLLNYHQQWRQRGINYLMKEFNLCYKQKYLHPYVRYIASLVSRNIIVLLSTEFFLLILLSVFGSMTNLNQNLYHFLLLLLTLANPIRFLLCYIQSQLLRKKHQNFSLLLYVKQMKFLQISTSKNISEIENI